MFNLTASRQGPVSVKTSDVKNPKEILPNFVITLNNPKL